MTLLVILPFILAVLQTICKDVEIIKALSYVLCICGMVIAIFLDNGISKKKKIAAEIQQNFDLYVYQMPWDENLFGKQRSVIYIVAKKSKVLLEKRGERKKLQGWYVCGAAADSVEIEKGILMCQKENFYWDVNLRKRYKLACISLFTSIILIIIGIGIWEKEFLITFLYRIVFIAPLVRWMIGTIKQLSNDINNLKELDESINSVGQKDMKNLLEIQAKLYNHRKNCFSIPNFFYKSQKDNDEDVAHRAAQMDIE